MILFEIQRIYTVNNQWYLEVLYKAIFAISYYGMMRVGEATMSPHVLLARNVHAARNKDKILLVLYSSKTHDKSNRPQKIKIMANRNEKSGHYIARHFCPFNILRQYISIRGCYNLDNEQFFIVRDKSPVKLHHVRGVLHTILNKFGLDSSLYGDRLL